MYDHSKQNARAQRYFHFRLTHPKSILKPLFLTTSILLTNLGPDTAQSEPISSTVLTSAAIDQIEGTISDQMQNAKMHADFGIWRAGQETLKALDHWKTVNSDLLDQTIGDIKAERKAFLTEIKAIWADVNINRSILVKAADDFNMKWASSLKDLPLTDDRTELYSYYPKVVISDKRKVVVTLAGPNIGLANAEIRFADGSGQKFSQSTDFTAITEVTIPDEAFSADAKLVKLKVVYQRDPDAWFFKEETEKELVFLKLPEKIGSYSLLPKIKVPAVERSTFDTRADAAGKNIHASVPVQVPPNLIKDGWKIDSETIMAKFHVNRQGVDILSVAGEKGSCNGINPNTLSDNGFVYNIHIGSTTRRLRSRGGWQHCNIRVPIFRDVEAVVPAEKTDGKLSWSSDTKIKLPENLDSFDFSFDQFDGKRIVLPEAGYTEFFDFQFHGNFVLLKPKLPINIPW